ncbi:MAG: hypothetical protein ACREJP_07800 [Candidatus Methylomirabilales bacterium]
MEGRPQGLMKEVSETVLLLFIAVLIMGGYLAIALAFVGVVR